MNLPVTEFYKIIGEKECVIHQMNAILIQSQLNRDNLIQLIKVAQTFEDFADLKKRVEDGRLE